MNVSEIMIANGISGVPVDGIGITIGVLTEEDLVGRIELGTDVDHEGLLAAPVCPVACIVINRDSYHVPNGRRRDDTAPIGSEIEARRKR